MNAAAQEEYFWTDPKSSKAESTWEEAHSFMMWRNRIEGESESVACKNQEAAAALLQKCKNTRSVHATNTNFLAFIVRESTAALTSVLSTSDSWHHTHTHILYRPRLVLCSLG